MKDFFEISMHLSLNRGVTSHETAVETPMLASSGPYSSLGRRDQRRRRAALVSLLRDLFSTSELSRAISQHPDGGEVLGEVPIGTSTNELVEAIVDGFIRRGIDEELFTIMVELRPRRFDEVHMVAEMWGVEVRLP